MIYNHYDCRYGRWKKFLLQIETGIHVVTGNEELHDCNFSINIGKLVVNLLFTLEKHVSVGLVFY